MVYRSNIALNYLEPNKQYVATIYADAKGADWQHNPTAYEIKRYLVSSQSTLKIVLTNGGGAAVSLKMAMAEDLKRYKNYSN